MAADDGSRTLSLPPYIITDFRAFYTDSLGYTLVLAWSPLFSFVLLYSHLLIKMAQFVAQFFEA